MKLKIRISIAVILILLFSIAWASEKQETSISFFKQKNSSPDIDTFMQIGSASAQLISPDGKTVYFINSFTNTSQLFKISSEIPYPYQLTFKKDSVRNPTISPDGKWIIFLSDRGGDEQYQLYIMDANTGRFEALTSEPEVRFGIPLWSPDMKKIYFRANRNNKANFSIYEMDLNTRNTKLLVGDPGYFGPSLLSMDGKLLVYYHQLSNVNSNLYLMDLENGSKKLLTPHQGEVNNIAITLSPDKKNLFYLSNDNPQGVMKLVEMDITSGKREIILDPESPWDIEEADVNRARDTVAMVINEDGYGTLKIFDLKRKELLPTPEFRGVVSSLCISDASTIAFTLTTAVKPSDVYTWDWNTKELKRITYSSFAGIDPSIFIEPELVHYRSFDGLEIPAFVFLPFGWEKNKGNIPFIIDFHGGPEGQSRPYFQRHFNYLLANGFGIMLPNIRGSDGYGKKFKSLDDYKKRMDSVKDGYYAALYLIEQGYTKKGKIGIKGSSYGGYMVLALLTEYPDMWGAAYESIGMADLVNFLKNTKPYRRKIREAEYGPLSDEKFLRSVSPIHKIDRIITPLMIQHGVNDPRVPVSEAYAIADNLKKRKIEVKMMIFEDEGHGTSKKENRLKLYREMMRFFEKYLK